MNNTPNTGADSPTPEIDWQNVAADNFVKLQKALSELAEARAEVEEHKAESKYRGEMSDSWRKSYGERLDEVHALRAQLAAMQQDKARLDWLLDKGVCWRDADKELPGEFWVIGNETEWQYGADRGRTRIDKAIALNSTKEAKP